MPLEVVAVKRKKLNWTKEREKEFQQIEKLVIQYILLALPNVTVKFVIHTDASDIQLGALIYQNSRPIAFYHRKLNLSQRRYTTTERELLSIVEYLRFFC